jgi:hypothetical protein
MSVSYIFTDNLGFVAVREGTPSAQDWAATYWNWINADAIIYNLIDHHHTGAAALANPDAAPVLTTADTGGTLLASTTYYGVVSFIDAYGRETAKSAAGSVTTTAAIVAPNTPTYNFQATPTDLVADISATPVGLLGGDYWYQLTYVKGGGETTPSQPVYVSIPTDHTYAATIHFDSLITAANGADKIFVYRKSGSTGTYVKLVEISATNRDYYTDDNTAVASCDKHPPISNTTNSFSTLTFDWSSLTYTDALFVNLYATTTTSSGDPTFSAANHKIATISVNWATPVETYIWTGTTLTTGKPLIQSQSLASPSKVILDSEVTGTLPRGMGGVATYSTTGVNWLSALPASGEEGELALVTSTDWGDTALFAWRESFSTPMWQRLNPLLPSEPFGHTNPGYYWEPGTMWLTQSHFEEGYYLSVVGWDEDTSSIPMSVSGIGVGMGWSDEGLTGASYTIWAAPVLHNGHAGYTGTVGWDRNIDSFAYWDSTLATPAWVKGPGVVKTATTVTDVTESATPTDVELKINELLGVLRTSGIIE